MPRPGKASRRGTSTGTFRSDAIKRNEEFRVAKLSDLGLSIGDDEMTELYEIDPIQARMLERGTGKLRKCKTCGDVYVNSRLDEIRWNGYLNRMGYICHFCRKGNREELRQIHNMRFERKREILKKAWDLYISRKNIGVTTYTIKKA